MTLPVSHAFHTEIVAPASEPLRTTLRRLDIAPPRIPVVANVDGELYPDGPDAVDRIIDILGRQVASPVQFVAGLRPLWAQGARVFVETGPKRALQGFASDVLGDDDALNLHTNHPKSGDLPSFNIALCGLYAAGYGVVEAPAVLTPAPVVATAPGGPPPSAAVLAGQAHQPQAGAVALFGGRHAFELEGDQALGVRPHRGTPGDELAGRPLAVGLVRGGHVLGGGRVCTASGIDRVHGDAAMLAVDLQRGRARLDLDFGASKAVRYAVVVALELDVVVGDNARGVVAKDRNKG